MQEFQWNSFMCPKWGVNGLVQFASLKEFIRRIRVKSDQDLHRLLTGISIRSTMWLKWKQIQDIPTIGLIRKILFILFAASAFRKLSSIYVFSYFPFGFEGGIWDLIVSVPDHCLFFYFNY